MAVPIVHVGVDVGGTNTDAVVLKADSIVGWAKKVTTADVTTGVANAITFALKDACGTLKTESLYVSRVHIGTTHFINALIQMKHLAKVAVIRLCGPATIDLYPFIDFPKDLKKEIAGPIYMLDGGFEFDGEKEIRPVNEDEILRTIKAVKCENISNIVVCGIFSSVNSSHEEEVKEIILQNYPDASVTLSHEIGQIGLLERENAAILNESLKPLCAKTVSAFRHALNKIGLNCSFYLTQNDGTLISAEQCLAQPVNTFASGPTNSMRGAAFLSGLKNAIVVDVGGTSTDVGLLMGGFPKEASYKFKVAKVRTNLRMPDVLSIGLGGGSKVVLHDKNGKRQVEIGPESVGFRLEKEAVVFGGKTLTASDFAVSGGLVEMGEKGSIKEHAVLDDSEIITLCLNKIKSMIEDTIDKMKTSKDDIPVILVGGGSVLVDTSTALKGTCGIIKPANFHVANAVGAALSQVSGSADQTFDLFKINRGDAIKQTKDKAIKSAIASGALEPTAQITDVNEFPLTYLPGNATRVRARAVGDLSLDDSAISAAKWSIKGQVEFDEDITSNVSMMPQIATSTGKSLMQDEDFEISASESDPHIDPTTGEWILSEWDIECITVGAGILGCGGGGDPYLGRLMSLNRLREGRKIRVITPERYYSSVASNTDLAVQAFIMGAPTIFNERSSCYPEVLNIIECMKELYDIGKIENGVLRNKEGIDIVYGDGVTYVDDYRPKQTDQAEKKVKVAGIFTIECGGSNCMVPLYTAPLLDLPVIDADCMGRAFPELYQNTSFIYGHDPYPACLSYYNQRRAVILHVDSPLKLETHFRQVCIDMGCAGGTTMSPLLKHEVWNPLDGGKVIHHSVSRVWRLGRAVWSARKAKTCPIDAILQQEGGKLLFWGKVIDVSRRTVDGFTKGDLTLDGFKAFAGKQMLVYFQNENVVAKLQKDNGVFEVVACVPDLITLVDYELGEPIPTEELRYGLRVAIIALPAPPKLRTPEALIYVGPQAHGYSEEEVVFQPMGPFFPHDPIPLK